MNHKSNGIIIELNGNEVATAIDAYLVAHGYSVNGPRTVRINGELCQSGTIFVDPSGYVLLDGEHINTVSSRGDRDNE